MSYIRILHLFQWRLIDIIPNLPKIKERGFNAIQINPIQPTKNDDSDIWWMSYQPIAFRIGNRFGDKEDLVELCNKAKEYDIKVIADVVCNHVASKDNGDILPHEKVDGRLTCNENFWKSNNRIYDWDNRWEVINYSLGLPTLNLRNYDLQDIVIEFLNELIACGVGGFRFDASKNISLPCEDGNQFWTRVLGNLNNKEDLFNYAEVIFSEKEIIDGYCEYVNVLTDSFGSDRSKLVTYIDSHDLLMEFGITSKMRDEDIVREYNLLTKQYPHTIFYARPFNDAWMDRKLEN